MTITDKLLKRLEIYGLYKEDLDISISSKLIMDNVYNKGITIEVKSYGLTVCSFSEETCIANLKRCFVLLETILRNYKKIDESWTILD